MATDKKKKGYSKQAMLKSMASGGKSHGHYTKYGDYDPRDVLDMTEIKRVKEEKPTKPKKGKGEVSLLIAPEEGKLITQYDKGMTPDQWARVLRDNHPPFAKGKERWGGKPFLFRGKLHVIKSQMQPKGDPVVGADEHKV